MAKVVHLTAREKDILAAINNHKSVMDAAKSIGMSYSCARTHLWNIRFKMDISDNWHAADKAEKMGLL